MTISGYRTYILIVSNLQGAEHPDEEKDETKNPIFIKRGIGTLPDEATILTKFQEFAQDTGPPPYRLVRIYVHSIIPDPTDPVAFGLFSDRLPVGEGIYVELYY